MKYLSVRWKEIVLNKSFYIIKREYLSRVKKKSFIILTLLVPLLLGLLMLVPYFLTQFRSGVHKIAVLDESGMFRHKIDNTKHIHFTFVESELSELKEHYKESFEAILYIPEIDINRPLGIKFFSQNQVGLSIISYVKSELNNAIREYRLEKKGLSKDFLDEINVKIDLPTIILGQTGEKKTNTALSAGMSYVMGFALYFLLLTYGTMSMRGVQEEKSNRIVEVIISSVKPFQLMLGKIIGIAAVALTQILIWIILGIIIFSILSVTILPDMATLQESGLQNANTSVAESDIINAIEGIKSINMTFILISFVFYSIFGYLFYSAMFAAVGSMINKTTSENQSITFPVILPIIIAFFIMINVLEQPHSSLAFWTSLIPFFSPIVMMARLPFEVPVWQYMLSVVLLIGGVIINIAIAGKIYKMAILLYGKKITFKEIKKWIFYR